MQILFSFRVIVKTLCVTFRANILLSGKPATAFGTGFYTVYLKKFKSEGYQKWWYL